MNSPPQNDFRPGLDPPQFRLRTLLIFIGLFCVLLAVSRFLGFLGTAVLVLFVLSIAAHVAGNAIGTRLRDGRGNRSVEHAHRPSLTDAHFAPTTQLSRNQSLGLTVVICVGFGVVCGGVIGGWLLAWAVGNKATWANMSFGIGAFGFLGGFIGFLASSFAKVLFVANREAWNHEKKNDNSL